MPKRYCIADLHLDHVNILKHCRQQFHHIWDMNETIIENWNKTVREKDIVYLLGDICWTLESFAYLRRLNGRIKIVLGNHDLFQVDKYLEVAEVVCGADQIVQKDFGKIVLTHIPVHTQQLKPVIKGDKEGNATGRFRLNVHGHLHTEKVNDVRYRCVSCEQVNFTPILIDEIVEDFMRKF